MPDIQMPQLGETVTEGTITKWFKQVGDRVEEDEVLFEVSTDKVDSEVPSPIAGTLTEILVSEGETVDVGTRLAVLSDGEAATSTGPTAESAPAEPPPAQEPEPEEPAAEEPKPEEPKPEEPAAQPAPPAPAAAPAAPSGPVARSGEVKQSQVVSPVVRKLAAENGIDLDQIQGSGAGGRISRDDVQRAIEGGAGRTAAPAAPAAALTTRRAGEAEQAVPLSNIRRRIGEHMALSKQVSPHAMTAVEVDFEAVERVRRAQGQAWAAEEGFTLTYLPFIARAVIDALHEYPHLNATVGDGELVLHNYVNLAIAVDLHFEGLLAPVIHDADQKRLRAIAREIHDLAERARSKQLSADDITGGTFTITNAGSYGTHMVIPIINQPQVAILSTDGVVRKPVVVTNASGDEAIAVHSVGLLPMSWDHRAFDGAYSAAFLARVREVLETRDWEAEL